MNDLSKRFNRHEFVCPCGCGFDVVDYRLIVELETLAQGFERLSGCRVAVIINSGNRCQAYDIDMKKRNGLTIRDKPSEHTRGWAADFTMEYWWGDGVREVIPANIVADELENNNPDRYGIGRYSDWTHFDARPVRARWGSNG